MEHVVEAPASGVVRAGRTSPPATGGGRPAGAGHDEAGGATARRERGSPRRDLRRASAPTSPRCSSATRSATRRARGRTAVATPAQDRAAHRPRERRRPLRPRQLRRVRRAGGRRAAPPAHHGRADRATRRPTAWSPASARVNGDAVRRRALALRRARLRLHRARRHAGLPEPPQEGPHVRAGRARRALPVVLFAEGGGGRPGDTDSARRRLGARLPGVPRASRRLSGLRAARRHHLGPLLRGQRRAARLLRRHHRDATARTSAWAAPR